MRRDEIAARIPHQGTMCLLEQAVSWDATHIHCRSSSHVQSNNPLRRRNQLAAVNLIEYAAQAAALHSGLQAEDNGEVRSGMLAALRDIKLSGADISQMDGPLDIHATQEMAAAAGMIYAFEVRAADTPLASGRLTIIAIGPNPNG